MTEPSFPPGFRFGAATSSYQVEGAVDEDGRGPSIWDAFSHTRGRVLDDATGDVACDHYHRLEEDLELLAWLGVDVYRFSVAWPRVRPDGVRREPRGLAFYDRLVDGLLTRGIEPFATLYHWDLPQALQEEGGWPERSTVDRFVDYAGDVVERLGDRVRSWATLNEPWCSAFLGHHEGVHAPGVRDPAQAVAAAHHLLLAHGRAAAAMRAALPAEAQVGIVVNPAPIRPWRDVPEDRAAARLVDGVRNRMWIDPLVHGRYPDDVLAAWEPVADLAVIRDGDLDEISGAPDLLGVNYYEPFVVSAEGDGSPPEGPGLDGIRQVPPDGPTTAMGWRIDAAGLEEVLVRLARDYPGVPLMVTENGVAFDDVVGPDGVVPDDDRIAYLDAHVRAAAAAVARGVDLRGYLVWTLLDNFEWSYGYRSTFGLVHVDRRDLARTPKRSAHWYRALLHARG